MDYEQQVDLVELLKPYSEDRDFELLPRESGINEIDRISKQMVAGRKQQKAQKKKVAQFKLLLQREGAAKPIKEVSHGRTYPNTNLSQARRITA